LLVFVVLVGVDLATLGGGGTPQDTGMPLAAEVALEAEEPALRAAPAPTPAPAPAMRAPADEDRKAGIPEPAADAAAPAEAPAPMEPPTAVEEEDDGTGRWVLRGFQGAAGAVFLVAVAALLWRRRPGRPGSRT
jgi:hypothetical protein